MRMCPLIILLTCGLAAGCKSNSGSAAAEAAADSADRGLAGCVGHVEAAETLTQGLLPAAAGETRPTLMAISGQHSNALADARVASQSISGMRTMLQDLADKIDSVNKQLGTLEGRWYVTLGRMVERIIFWAGVLWLIGTLGSVAFGILLPGSGIAGSLIHALPLGNVAVWILKLCGR